MLGGKSKSWITKAENSTIVQKNAVRVDQERKERMKIHTL